MRGRAAVPTLFLVVFFLAAAAFPACSFTPLYSGQFRATFFDVAADGSSDLWTATSYGIALYDRGSNPPRLAAKLALPGITRIVRVANGIAYAASGSKIYAVQRSGSGLAIAGNADAGVIINDLLVQPGRIFAATAAGIVQFDLFDTFRAVRSPNVFPTSSPNVLALALAADGTTLYAADGDSSVELFSVATPTPQLVGTLASLPRASSVRVGGGGKLYVSDGQQTDIFAGGGALPTKVTTVAFGATAFAALTPDVVFTAGNDRELRAVDFSAASTPVELYETSLSPSGGTVNRVVAMQLAGGRLYAAAGDAGLLTFDVGAFTSPFPVRGYDRGATTSILSLGTKLYVTPSTGSIIEYVQSASGSLTQARQWSSGSQQLHDGNANGFLLSSSGSTLTYWSLISSTPVAISSVAFAKPVVSAALVGNIAYALLTDQTLASADMAQLSPVPTAIALDAMNPTAIARSGSSLAIADLRDDATTRILFFATPDFTAAPRVATVPGIATSGLALGGTTAAVFTFSGINVVDFSSAAPQPTAIPGSTAALAESLAIAGSTLVEATERSLLVWDLRTRTLQRALALPADAVAVSVSPDSQSGLADLATSTGIVTANYLAAQQTPSMLAAVNGNNYYRRIAATADRLYLFDGRGVDIFASSSATVAPHFIASIRPSGILDFAVTANALYTLTSGGTVASYSPDGALLAQLANNEGSDAQWLSIAAANGAPWVGYAKGCLTGGCQKRTLVLDPQSLVETATLPGAVTATAMDGTRVYALFDLPAELRAYDAADPLHPSLVAARATDGTRAPVSLAAANGTLFVLGDRLFTYDANSLAPAATLLDDWTADPSAALAYVDQRIYADAGCTLATGRTFAVQPIGETATSIGSVPAAVKSIAVQNGRLLLLTDDSIEIWSKSPAAPPSGRRRASR
jgi:WD40 repeat protein